MVDVSLEYRRYIYQTKGLTRTSMASRYVRVWDRLTVKKEAFYSTNM